MVRQEEIDKLIIEIYQTTFRSFYKKTKRFKVNLTTADLGCIRNFVKRLGLVGNNYNIEFLQRYTEFQFNQYMAFKSADDKIWKVGLVTWIYGPKAWDRWKTCNDYNRLKRTLDFKVESETRHTVKKDDEVGRANVLLEIYDFEEKEKHRYYNSEEGLAWCVLMTTMYNSNSQLCRECENNRDCKEFLRQNIPELAKVREI